MDNTEESPPAEKARRDWPHAPLHRLEQEGVYFVTSATYQKEKFFDGPKRLKELHNGLLKYARMHAWRLEAWAVFPNHFHIVAGSPTGAEDGAESLATFLSQFHTKSATWVNRLDKQPGRQVWYNFRDTQLTFPKSYFARLKYTHFNAVHHGIVKTPNQYRWCSAASFERNAKPSYVKTIYSFKIDKLKIDDDF